MALFVVAVRKPAGNFHVSGGFISHHVMNRSGGKSFDQIDEKWSVGIVLSFPDWLY